MGTIHFFGHNIFEFISLQLIVLSRLTNHRGKFQIRSWNFGNPFKSHLNLALTLPVIHHGYVLYTGSHWSLYKRRLG
jgi:hypothetical protein